MNKTTSYPTYKAARDLLAAHDALRLVSDAEPELDDEGMPRDGAAWVVWYEGVYLPASRSLRQARENLAAVLGEDVPGHPYAFRPLCDRIIGEAGKVG